MVESGLATRREGEDNGRGKLIYSITEEAHEYYLLTVRFGIRTYRAYLEWCKEAEEILRK
ncbi:MAG: hypothetical protein GX235_12450 [Clostridiales bacterium]|nr:hypothetical protein [Clostridiales bacterium]